MAVHVGNLGDIFIATGAGVAFTDEACTLVSGTTFQINDAAKRYWDYTAAFSVKDGLATLAATEYELVHASGKIILKSAPGGAVTVTGKYLTTAQFGQAFNWKLDYEYNMVPTQTFGDAWDEFTPTTAKGSVSFERFYDNEYFHSNLGNPFVLVLYTISGTTQYRCIARMTQNSISTEESDLIRENVSFVTIGRLDYAAVN